MNLYRLTPVRPEPGQWTEAVVWAESWQDALSLVAELPRQDSTVFLVDDVRPPDRPTIVCVTDPEN